MRSTKTLQDVLKQWQGDEGETQDALLARRKDLVASLPDATKWTARAMRQYAPEVFLRAQKGTPQLIARSNGEMPLVVISMEQAAQLMTGTVRHPTLFGAFGAMVRVEGRQPKLINEPLDLLPMPALPASRPGAGALGPGK